MPEIIWEIGSFLGFILLVVLAIDNRKKNDRAEIRTAAKAEEKAKSGDELVKKLVIAIDDTKDKMFEMEKFCTGRCATTDGKFNEIEHFLHNGMSGKIDRILTTVDQIDKTNDDQWKAISEIREDMARLGGSK